MPQISSQRPHDPQPFISVLSEIAWATSLKTARAHYSRIGRVLPRGELHFISRNTRCGSPDQSNLLETRKKSCGSRLDSARALNQSAPCESNRAKYRAKEGSNALSGNCFGDCSVKTSFIVGLYCSDSPDFEGTVHESRNSPADQYHEFWCRRVIR